MPTTDAPADQVGIRLYIREGVATADFRVLELGALNFDRPPPLPILLQTRNVIPDGHNGAEVAGTIHQLGRVEETIICEGILDLGSEAGREAARLIHKKVLTTWSPDVGNPQMVQGKAKKGEGPPLTHFSAGTIIGATIVPLPAVDTTYIELFSLETGEVLMAASQSQLTASGSISIWEGTTLYHPASIAFSTSTSANWPTSLAASLTTSLTAAAPPASHFSKPKLDSLQRYVTITEDGRIFGHLADAGHECHIGYGDTCVSAPQEPDYSAFAVGTVQTADGTLIPTGPIALKGGHANTGLSAQAARAHYDDPSTAKADVAIGTDSFGIWFSGSLRPGVTEEDIHALRASGVSGDWRKIDGQLRLIGICSVNVPGFPKLALAASADGDIESLVAAGGPPVAHPEDCGCTDNYSELVEELDDLQRLVADAGLEQVAIDRLASRIPDDDIDTLFERIS